MEIRRIEKLKDKRLVEPIAPIQKVRPIKGEEPRFDISLRDHMDKLRQSKKEKFAMVTRISARERDDDEANLEDTYSDPDAIEDAQELREEKEREKIKQALEDGTKKKGPILSGDDEDDEDTSDLGAGAEALDIKDLQELALLKQQLVKERKEQARIALIRKRHVEWMRKNKPTEVFKDWLRANFPELYIAEFESKVAPSPVESIQVEEESPYPIGTGYTPEETENIKSFWKDYEEQREAEKAAKAKPSEDESEDFEVAETTEEDEKDEGDKDSEEVVVEEIEEDPLLSKEELDKEKEDDKDVDFSSESAAADKEQFVKEYGEMKPEEDEKAPEAEKKKKKGRGEAYDKRVVQVPKIEDLATFAYLPAAAAEYDYDTEDVIGSFGEDDEYNLGKLRQKFKGKIPKASPRIKEQIADLIKSLYKYKLDEYTRTTRSKSSDPGVKEIMNEEKLELSQIDGINDLEAQDIKFKLAEIQKHINRLSRKSAPIEAVEEEDSEDKEPK